MENRAHALATGIFILLLGVLLVVVAAWFQDNRDEAVSYTVVSRSGVPGLNVKAPVRLHGVRVGKVEAIEFDPADSRQILITLNVDKTAPLTQTTLARLGYQGITGLSFIDLFDEGGLGVSPRLEASSAARIELRPSLVDQLSDSAPKLLAQAGDVAERLKQLLSEANQQQLTRSLAGFNEASAGVVELSRALKPVLAALPALTQQTAVLLKDADSTLKQVDGLTAESIQLARDLRQRSAVLDRLGEAATQLQTTTQRLDASLMGSGPARALPLLDVWRQSGSAIERTAKQLGELGEQPQSLIFGPAAPLAGPGEAGFDVNARAGR